MVVETEDGGHTKTALDAVEVEVDEVDSLSGGRNESAVIAIIVVGAQTYSSGKVVGDAIGEV